MKTCLAQRHACFQWPPLKTARNGQANPLVIVRPLAQAVVHRGVARRVAFPAVA
jgi:hypothetical protein